MENIYFLEEATRIAVKAGEILNSYWGKLKSVSHKNTYWDLVTEADLASEKYILGELFSKFPSHEVLSEEAGLSETKNVHYQWLVDPLDGTTNFTHQYPFFCVTIGLSINGVPTVGVTYDPLRHELFQAIKGQGAVLNGEKIAVSQADSLDRSLLATGFAYDRKENKDNNYREFCHITGRTQGVRRGGSAALDLAYVAAGRLDGYWERGLKPWDMAAGIVLVSEAGGIVTSYENGPIVHHSGRILASNGKIHEILSKELLGAANP